MTSRPWIFLVSAILCCSAGAQSVFMRIPGATAGDQFGIRFQGAGDIDGDGTPDLIVGAPGAQRAFLISGADRSIIRTLQSPLPPGEFGADVAAVGDVNGDGATDFVVGDPKCGLFGTDAGAAFVFSGLDGSLIHSLYGFGDRFLHGSRVAGVGDVDGDGRPDLAVSALGEQFGGTTTRGAVWVYSGASGQILFHVREAGDLSGVSVIGGRDADGDGRPDFAYGAWGGSTGKVALHSGRTGQTLQVFQSWHPNSNFKIGASVAFVDDADGDVRPDLLTGTPRGGGSNPTPGFVTLFSTATAARLRVQYGDTDGDQFGVSVCCPGDVDADGVDDYVVGASFGVHPTAGQVGYVRVFSGRNGNVLATLYGDEVGGRFGAWLAPIGDVLADGHADFAVGASAMHGGAGQVSLVSGRSLSLTTDRDSISVGAGGSQRLILNPGPAHALDGYVILGGASGTSPGFALGGVQVPLNLDGLSGLYIDSPNTLVLGSVGTFDLGGEARARFVLPPSPPAGIVGLEIHHVFVVLDLPSLSWSFASNPASLRLDS